ncbi:hypothetical protein [Pseudomonas aeruginosa]|uniref:hypothetical protein n=1 Tax=Pseudomonas aeruginosa TaxID=287 RepID=UPI00106BDAF0|nr:hypothetical protein [Pseudomonas aeruginosa]HBO2785639.1 hypothetical protein [Pseudomonas aeruginosa]HCF3446210.1 hypothetical protein [Pseudomonas aeruginosa]HCF3458545.1 hypothetical protein [Pseudomonas aeruginosa]
MLSDKQIRDGEWYADEIIDHFDDFIEQKQDDCDWLDIGREGARLVGLLIRQEIESDSSIDAVITSISSASDSLAYGRIASAFGMTRDEFEDSIERYLSSGVELSIENFYRFCKKETPR